MKMNLKKGFTLIELLVVIAIIGILASIVLTSLTSAREKANRTSVLSSLSSMGPELVVCADDGGFGYTLGAPTGGTTYICQNVSTGTGNVQKTGHTVVWPTLPTTGGWAYGTPGGTSDFSGTYTYTATKTGQTPVTCTFVNSNVTCS